MSTHNRDDQPPSVQTVSFGDMLSAIRRGAPLALVATGIALAAALLLTQRMEPVYQAQASVIASRPTSNFGDLDLVTPPAVDARVYQRALQEGDVVHDALFSLDGRSRSVAEMERFMEKVSVSVEVHDISSLISISVRDGDPQLAAAQANAIAEQLIAWDRDRARAMVEDSIAAIERAIAQIDEQIAAAVDSADQLSAQRLQTMSATQRENLARELETARVRSASAVVVGLLGSLNGAQVPVEPIAPRPVFNAFVAILLGLIIGYGLQFARWSLDDRVTSRKGLADATGLPVLGMLPAPRRGLRLSQEAVGKLRAGLMGAFRGSEPAVIGIACATSFHEKSGVATSLADSLARSGYRTLLIDADLKNAGPGYGVDVSRFAVPRLEAYLHNPALPLEPLGFAIDSKRSFDALLPSGTGEPFAGPLQASLGSLVERLRDQYDVVIFDIPPVLLNPDAIAAASVCTYTTLCVGVGAKRDDAREAAAMLERSDVEVVGAFLTGTGKEGTVPRRPAKVDIAPIPSRSGSRSSPKAEAAPHAYARVKPR